MNLPFSIVHWMNRAQSAVLPIHRSGSTQSQGLNVTLLTPNAVFPERVPQPGVYLYTVTLLSKVDDDDDTAPSPVSWYRTGLILNPDQGFVASITSSTSLIKAGYFIPNPILIPSGTNQELVVPLFRYGAESLELPVAGCRLLLIPNQSVFLKSVAPPVDKSSSAPKRKKPKAQEVEFLSY